MSRLVATALLVLLAGCAPRLTEQQVEGDFRRLMAAEYKALKLQQVRDVAFGDGWDDGVELVVYFDVTCAVRGAAVEGIGQCADGPMRMEMSYQWSQQGNWRVLSSELHADNSPERYP